MVSYAREIPPNVTKQWKQMIEPYYLLCGNETHIAPDVLITMLTDSSLPTENRIHCFWKCILEHKGFEVNGRFDTDLIAKEVYLVTPEGAKLCAESAYREEELCKKTYVIVQCTINFVMDKL
ncbi:uncharacterized protein LOC116170199 [Photinus pyralis]|uniref:uncharacterized protein LOC116170199 n=1 Tax=Photinus pyralis TaxID=7054 RepID=UPI0012676FF9|nr:uncharacterized protein LOC116170199 [Photinus pyralis]